MMKRDLFKTALQGMAMGTIDIVPGVSGSTIAVLFGIYERFIAALKNIDLQLLKATFGLFRHGFSKDARRQCLNVWQKKDTLWLLNLVTGLGCAIVAASFFIPWLTEQYPDVTRGFFFGLVLGSTITPILALNRPKWLEIIFILVFGVACYVLLGQHFSPPSNLVTQIASEGVTYGEMFRSLPSLLPPDAVAAMPQNEALRAAVPAITTTPQSELTQLVLPAGTPVTLPAIPLYFSFIAGFAAICAMLLPGISGSFILLVLGLYYGALNAARGTFSALAHAHFATEHILVLSLLALGAIAGVATFSRALTWLFNHYRRLTMAAITGILLGCLRAVWPFRATQDGLSVNVMPTLATPHFFSVILAGLCALGLVIFVVYSQHKKTKTTTDNT
ncbi:MAG: DUF368 domain-containing protein [Proteobacteria bacterium]|nr:DUF368 domain-containing protein [Pseudomonadota bacterium]